MRQSINISSPAAGRSAANGSSSVRRTNDGTAAMRPHVKLLCYNLLRTFMLQIRRSVHSDIHHCQSSIIMTANKSMHRLLLASQQFVRNIVIDCKTGTAKPCGFPRAGLFHHRHTPVNYLDEY